MKNRAVALAGLGGAMLLSGTFAAGVARADDKTYTIAPKYTAGDVVKYKMKSNMKMEMTTESGQPAPFPGGDMTTSMSIKLKTTKVDESGTATIVTSVSGGEMSFMGQSMAMPETPPVTMEVDKRGMSKKISGLDKVEGMAAMSQMFNMQSMPSSGFFYPDHPVKVGETWDAEMPSISGPKKMKVSSTLVSVDMVGGKETYKIKQSWTIPMEMMIGQGGPTKNADEAIMVMSGEFTSAGDVLVDAESGRYTKIASDVKGAMAMEMKGAAAQQSPFGSKMNIKLDGKSEMALAAVGAAADEPEKVTTKPTTKPAAVTGSKPAGAKPGTKPAKKPVRKP